jgi:hypothetical protein
VVTAFNRSWCSAITGVATDNQNHVWVVHRGADSLENNEKGMMLTPPSASTCCVAAPFVVELDQKGGLVSSWGGPGQGYAWPQSPGGLTVDTKGNVWIAAAGLEPPPTAPARGRGDAVVGEARPPRRVAGVARRRPDRQMRTSSSSRAMESSCCRSVRLERWMAPTARRR